MTIIEDVPSDLLTTRFVVNPSVPREFVHHLTHGTVLIPEVAATPTWSPVSRRRWPVD